VASIVNCECGEVIRAETDDDLVEAVTAHVERDHPELIGKLSRDDMIAMAEET
jgi:predicted small metal-binding protein